VIFAVPISLPLYLFDSFLQFAWNTFWSNIEICIDMKKHDVIDKTVLDDFKGERFMFRLFSYFSFYVDFALLKFTATLCSAEIVRDVALIVRNVNEEGTPLFRLLEELDYTRYDWIMNTIEYLKYQTQLIRWMISIAYRAPSMWYNFLFIPIADSHLPVRRDACTLREAQKVLINELDSIEKRIVDESKRNDVQIVKKKESNSDVNLKLEDKYGKDFVWEVLEDTCLNLLDAKDGYSYELCFFGSFRQGQKINNNFSGKTLIGKFSNWFEQDTKLKIELSKNFLKYMTTNHDENNDDSNLLIAEKMQYAKGEYCYAAKRDRHAVISFSCATMASILSVQEFEVIFLCVEIILCV
jgi:hypothetical protein